MILLVVKWRITQLLFGDSARAIIYDTSSRVNVYWPAGNFSSVQHISYQERPAINKKSAANEKSMIFAAD